MEDIVLPIREVPELWFFGTGTFAARSLALLTNSLRFSLVVTSPPSLGGRGLKQILSPVEELCAERGIPLHRSRSVASDEELLKALERSRPHSILVVDFGQKIREPFLSTPLHGCLNIHPSLLPRYRGAAPVQRALMNGDDRTGVTLFRLVEEMDAGPILFQDDLCLAGHETAGEVLDVLAARGGKLYQKGVQCLIEGSCSFTDQNSESVSYAPKIANNEAEFFWHSPTRTALNLIRALNPAPGAFVQVDGKRLKVWEAAVSPLRGTPGQVLGFEGGCPVIGMEDGALVLRSVQPEGKKRMDGGEWARGVRLQTKGVLH
ncbi:MAG TPA: methionyl-tRNA formyltransferase [Synergistaceae bacterium]|nr:methionyl-tRNA formyltransferase [Synergistaceae bacterium]